MSHFAAFRGVSYPKLNLAERGGFHPTANLSLLDLRRFAM
jgi:hypothetical protein